MKRRGMTLIELMTSIVFLSMVFLGFGAMMTSGMEQFQRQSNDATVTSGNAQNMRRITDALRGAMNISISGTGQTISFNNPKLASTLDPVTGEKELIVPLTSDGIARGYSVNFTTGQLTDTNSGRVLLRNVISTDPEVKSSQYGKVYTPFSFSTVGGQQVVVVNLITQTGQANYKRYQRFKTAVYLRY